ncbi:MAG TPA: hypothetical protein VJR28_06680, partial [Chthoniobacterales bacterium]|nr:hypothetical protein [Chthoniobacterales bacterium]
PASLKLLEKSEAGRPQWIFEAPSSDPGGVPTRFTFRKPPGDKSENVLLHEFSGSLRVDGDKVVPGGPADALKLGLAYMMLADKEHEVSEFVWDEIQAAKKSGK